MKQNQTDRRPDEKPQRQTPAGADVTKQDALRRAPDESEDRKGFGKPEGGPIEKPLPVTGPERRGKDVFDGERSDRESGRPIQLEDDEAEPGMGGGRPQEGFEDRKHETKR